MYAPRTFHRARLPVALVSCLFAFGCARDVDDWLEDVRSEDEYQRLMAVVALGVLDPGDRADEVAAELVNVLEDPEPDVKDAAHAALKRQAIPLCNALIRLAARADVVRYQGAPPPTFVRQAAAQFAWMAGPIAIDPLLEALRDPETIDRGLIANTLGRIGEPAIDPLLRLIRESEDPFVRNLAIMGLGRALAESKTSPAAVLAGSATGDARNTALQIVRETIRYSLPETLTHEWVEERLRRLLGSDKAKALEAEIELQLVQERLVPILVDLIDRETRVADQAALLLFRLDPSAIARAFPLLDPSRPNHALVLERLLSGVPNPGRFTPLLVALATGQNEAYALRAVHVLRGLGADAKAALPALDRLSTGAPEPVRSAAREAARRIRAETGST